MSLPKPYIVPNSCINCGNEARFQEKLYCSRACGNDVRMAQQVIQAQIEKEQLQPRKESARRVKANYYHK